MTENNKAVLKNLVKFAIPYMIAAFLQTLYGLIDMFVVGFFNNAATTTAVAVGSQIMHMIVVVIVGLTLGITVQVGNNLGAQNTANIRKTIASAIIFFMGISLIMMVVLLLLNKVIVGLVLTPVEAANQTRQYFFVATWGIPFIFFYNIFSAIFRGLGDSKRPMYAVAIGGLVNVGLDFLFVGAFHLQAKGAAIATVVGQLFSGLIIYALYKKNMSEYVLKKHEYKIHKPILKNVVYVGVPVALQDGFIQVAFMVITVIANSRGLIDSAAVGVVEKLICFFFLVPSAFMSAVSAITAQCHGGQRLPEAKITLKYGLIITVCWGILIALICQVIPDNLVGIFTRDEMVKTAGAAYLKGYSIDTALAAIHFCFSGYFCGIQKSYISFVHNLISVLFVRVPGSYLASKMFVDSLFPMGLAAPAGSLVSAVICVIFYYYVVVRPIKMSS